MKEFAHYRTYTREHKYLSLPFLHFRCIRLLCCIQIGKFSVHEYKRQVYSIVSIFRRALAGPRRMLSGTYCGTLRMKLENIRDKLTDCAVLFSPRRRKNERKKTQGSRISTIKPVPDAPRLSQSTDEKRLWTDMFPVKRK